MNMASGCPTFTKLMDVKDDTPFIVDMSLCEKAVKAMKVGESVTLEISCLPIAINIFSPFDIIPTTNTMSVLMIL